MAGRRPVLLLAVAGLLHLAVASSEELLKTPPHSTRRLSEAQGVERWAGICAGLVRTFAAEVEARWGFAVNSSSTYLPWAIRHDSEEQPPQGNGSQASFLATHLAATKEAQDSDEVQPYSEEQSMQWTPAAIAVAGAVGLPYLLLTGFCLARLCCGTSASSQDMSCQAVLQDCMLADLVPAVDHELLKISEEETDGRTEKPEKTVMRGMPRLEQLVKSQALINRLAMLCGALLLLATGGTSIAPALTAAVVLPSMARSRWIEQRHLHLFGPAAITSSDVFELGIACLENFDDFSDGVVIASMYRKDYLVQGRFVESFAVSKLSCLTPLMGRLHMWGLALLFLLLSQAAQWAWALASLELESEFSTALDLVGFGALASRHSSASRDPAQARGFRTFNVGLTRVVLENVPSGLIASSFIMFVGVKDLSEEPVALVSTLLSTFSLLKKSVEIMTFPMGHHSRCNPLVWGFALVMGIITLLAAVWILAKLWFIQICPDHAWQLSSGCMKLS